MADAVPPDATPDATPGRLARAAAASTNVAQSSADQLANMVELAAAGIKYLAKHLRIYGIVLMVLTVGAAIAPVGLWYENQGTPGAIVIAIVAVVGIVAGWVPSWAAWRARRALVRLAPAIRTMPGESLGYLSEVSSTLIEIRDQKGSMVRNTFRLRHLRNLQALAEKVGVDDVGALVAAPGMAFTSLMVSAVVFAILLASTIAGIGAVAAG